jgi:hypothetical protein
VVAHRLSGSDDYIFQQQIKPYPTLWSWLDYRYHSWSGRFFSEAFMYIFSPLPLFFWKIVNIVMYIVFCFYVFLIHRLVSRKPAAFNTIITLCLACAVPYLMSTYAFHGGTLWVTGAMAYYWIFVCGLVGVYPVVHAVFSHSLPKWYYSVVGGVGLIVATTSQEQIGAIIVALLLFFNILLIAKYLQKKLLFSVLIIPSIFFVAACLGFLASISAPGNDARMSAEILRWLPDFHTIPIALRANYSLRWFLDAFINHTGFLMPLFWTGLAGVLYVQGKRTLLHYLAILGLVLLTIVTALKGYLPFSLLFNFHAQWDAPTFSFKSNALLLAWVGTLTLTLLCTLLVKDIKIRLTSLLSIGGAIAATLLVALSPTMYASGARTLFVPSMAIAASIITLYYTLMTKRTELLFTAGALIGLLALAQYVFLLATIIF